MAARPTESNRLLVLRHLFEHDVEILVGGRRPVTSIETAIVYVVLSPAFK